MKIETACKPISSFSLFALTNIFLLLLVFLLITSQFMMLTGVKFKLNNTPNSSAKESVNNTVSITETGKIFIGTKEIALANLSIELDKLKRNGKLQNFTINADKSVKIDLVMKVINGAKIIGVDKFSIQTDKISF